MFGPNLCHARTDFLRQMGELYEVVVFTASLSKVRVVFKHYAKNYFSLKGSEPLAVCGSSTGHARSSSGGTA